MHRFEVRGFVVIPALAALMLLAVGCSSSGYASPPKASAHGVALGGSVALGGHVVGDRDRLPQDRGHARAGGEHAQQPRAAPVVRRAQGDRLPQQAEDRSGQPGANPALSSAVNQFAGSVQKALTSVQSNPGNITSLIGQLTKASQKISTACKNATG